MVTSLWYTALVAAVGVRGQQEYTPDRSSVQAQFQQVASASYLFPPANPEKATPTVSPPSYTPRPPKANGACATVSKLVANAPPSSTPTIAADVAWACEQSVPLNATSGLALLSSMRPYIEWQSTLAYLKNPPKGYLEPAVDVYAEFDSIESKLKDNGYKNEWEFEFELYRVFQGTHDGHFRYLPNILGIFGYFRTIPLVSVSTDSEKLPKPYVYSDIVQSQAGKMIKFSPVTKIDGQDALKYLENWSQFGSLQDPDALYNEVFYELAPISLGTGSGVGTFAGGGRGAYNYPGPTTTLTFANGTSRKFDNFARVKKSFKNIKTGQDVYNQLLDAPLTDQTAASAAATPASIPAPGYPSPVIREASNLIGGYYLRKAGYEDVAVLSVPTFLGNGEAPGSFLNVGFSFLKQAYKDGKKKLIIDVSANGGGVVHEGYNLFTELFRKLVPYGATRFRTHEAYNVLGQFISNISGPNYPPDDTALPLIDFFAGTPFNYRADIDNSSRPFRSWPQKYGPKTFYGDNFTPIIRWNLSDYYGIALNVAGYGNRTNVVKNTYFEPENIVVVYDGYCASTCTIFSEFMRQQGKVKAVAFGGRSRSGMIQAVGGTKGTNDYPWTAVFGFANSSFALATPQQRRQLAKTALGKYTTLPFRRGDPSFAALNARDGLREGDAAQVPLQFRYEPADCRLYYTPAMTVDVTAIWRAAADSTWGGKKCAAGGISGSSSVDALGAETIDADPAVVDVAALLESQAQSGDLTGPGAY